MMPPDQLPIPGAVLRDPGSPPVLGAKRAPRECSVTLASLAWRWTGGVGVTAPRTSIWLGLDNHNAELIISLTCSDQISFGKYLLSPAAEEQFLYLWAVRVR